MKRLFFVLVTILFVGFTSFTLAQTPSNQDKPEKVEEKQAKKISLSDDDKKFFQSIIDKNNREIEEARKTAEMAAKILEQTQRAGQLEVQNVLLQLKEKYGATGLPFDFNSMGWVEKASKLPDGVMVEKQGK